MEYTRSVLRHEHIIFGRVNKIIVLFVTMKQFEAFNLCNLQYAVKFQVSSAMAVSSIVWYVTPCKTER
jgi:hypothetical protein